MAEDKLAIITKETIELVKDPNASKLIIAGVGGFMSLFKTIFSKNDARSSENALEMLEKVEKDQEFIQENITAFEWALEDALKDNEELQKQLEAKNKEVREELDAKGHTFTDNSVKQTNYGIVKDMVGGNKITNTTHTGSGDNVTGDKNVTNYLSSEKKKK